MPRFGETLRTGGSFLCRRLFWLLALAIAVLALWPGLTLPEPAATQGATQYFHHVHAFLLLMLVGTAGWGLSRGLVLGVTLSAIGLELAQTLSPGRQAALADMLASLVGVALGYALARLILSAMARGAVGSTDPRPEMATGATRAPAVRSTSPEPPA